MYSRTSMNAPHSARIYAVTRKQGRHSLIRLRDAELPVPRPGQYLRVNGVPWPVIAVDTGGIDCFTPRDPPSPGSSVDLAGPLGEGFEPRPGGALLLGDEAGLAALVFLATQLLGAMPALALLRIQEAPPLRLRPSRILVPGMPAEAIATVGLLEDGGMACRVSSAGDLPGCTELPPPALARRWLAGLASGNRPIIYACGEAALLNEARTLARDHGLAIQGVTAHWAG